MTDAHTKSKPVKHRRPAPAGLYARARTAPPRGLAADMANLLGATTSALDCVNLLRQELRAAIERKPTSALKDLTTAVSKLGDELAGITQAVETLGAQVAENTVAVRRFLPMVDAAGVERLKAEWAGLTDEEVDRQFREGMKAVAAELERLQALEAGPLEPV